MLKQKLVIQSGLKSGHFETKLVTTDGDSSVDRVGSKKHVRGTRTPYSGVDAVDGRLMCPSAGHAAGRGGGCNGRD